MKKLMVLIWSLLIFSGLYAQDSITTKSGDEIKTKIVNDRKFYLKIGSGYSFGFEKTIFAQNEFIWYSFAAQNLFIETENKRHSLGEGINFNATIGYKLNKKIGFELGSSFIKSKKIVSTNVLSFFSILYDTIKYTYKGSAINFTPSVVYFANSKKYPIEGYVSLGLILAVPSLTMEFERYFSDYITDYYYYKAKFRFKNKLGIPLSIGHKISLGVSYQIPIVKNNFSVSIETVYNNLRVSPSEAEIIVYEVNGVDSLNSLTLSQKKVLYVDKYTRAYKFVGNDLVEDIDPNKAYKMSKFEIPFGSIGFNISLKYEF